MENERGGAEDQAGFFQEIKNVVDECVYKKMSILEAHHQKVDASAIEDECVNQVFELMETKVTNEISKIPRFFNQLMEDDQELCNSINAIANGRSEKNMAQGTFLPEGQLDKLFILGNNWYSKQEYDKAYLYFSYLTMVDPQNGSVWMGRGMVEQQLKSLDDALISYKNAIQLDTGNIEAYVNFMGCLVEAKYVDVARDIYEDFIQTADPKEITTLGNDYKELLNQIKSFVGV